MPLVNLVFRSVPTSWNGFRCMLHGVNVVCVTFVVDEDFVQYCLSITFSLLHGFGLCCQSVRLHFSVVQEFCQSLPSLTELAGDDHISYCSKLILVQLKKNRYPAPVVVLESERTRCSLVLSII